MQTAARTWRHYRPHLLAPIHAPLRVRPDVLKSTPPLYERRPPWWARFTYTFIAADLLVTAAMAELAFDTWTQEVSSEAKVKDGSPQSTSESTAAANRRPDATSSSKDSPVPVPGPPAKKEYALRPLWQRLPVALAQLGIGVGIALMILTSHARVVRRLRILPASALESQPTANLAHNRLPPSTAPNPSSTIQTRPRHSNSRTHAKKEPQPQEEEERFLTIESASRSTNTFPLSSCALERGTNDSEVLLTVHGIRGTFWLGLPSARLNGAKEPRAAWDVKEALYTAFYGKEGKRIMAREGWVDGPAVTKGEGAKR